MTTTQHDDVAFCLQQIGLDKPSWKSLVTAAWAVADKPADRLWAKWSDLPRWPEWSTPLHSAAHWVSGDSFVPDAQFEQVLRLGFPLGRTTSRETVRLAEPGRLVSWSKDESGVRSYHMWRFEPLSGGRTRVSDVEVFYGTPIAVIKPLVRARWRRLFQTSVENLIAAA